jgi:hypothetical protein
MTHEHTASGDRYDVAIGRLLDDYPTFWIGGSPDGLGYRARMRAASGMLAGRELAALTLDELAGKMDEMLAGVESAAELLRAARPDDGGHA